MSKKAVPTEDAIVQMATHHPVLLSALPEGYRTTADRAGFPIDPRLVTVRWTRQDDFTIAAIAVSGMSACVGATKSNAKLDTDNPIFARHESLKRAVRQFNR